MAIQKYLIEVYVQSKDAFGDYYDPGSLPDHAEEVSAVVDLAVKREDDRLRPWRILEVQAYHGGGGTA